jgi:hypothetical protein
MESPKLEKQSVDIIKLSFNSSSIGGLIHLFRLHHKLRSKVLWLYVSRESRARTECQVPADGYCHIPLRLMKLGKFSNIEGKRSVYSSVYLWWV